MLFRSPSGGEGAFLALVGHDAFLEVSAKRTAAGSALLRAESRLVHFFLGADQRQLAGRRFPEGFQESVNLGDPSWQTNRNNGPG